MGEADFPMAEPRVVAIVGAGIFGLSLARALNEKGHKVTVFDRNRYDLSRYDPSKDRNVQAASVDFNKIFRASYGAKIHYQRLALESREGWVAMNKDSSSELFINCGMLRVQPTEALGELEKETLANMERDGLRDTQFVESNRTDRQRAASLGWEPKLLEFNIPDDPEDRSFEAVLDSLSGLTRCSEACAYYQAKAADEGVTFVFGPEEGAFESLVESADQPKYLGAKKKKIIGIRTKDGVVHQSDVVVIAAGSFSTQLLPELSYHLESSGGSVATFLIAEEEGKLWDKYSPDKFPVITWKSAPRDKNGKDTGSVYVFPRTSEGVIKIGYRGIKFTNFQTAPDGTPFTQNGQWSIPLSSEDSELLPDRSVEAVRHFVSIFLPEFKDSPFHSTKLCWYTDSLDNSFVVDYVPNFADNSVFVCTGGSGHGAKFLPALGKHAADIFDNLDNCSSYMRPFWRWREDAPRRNGLDEGPSGPRNIGRKRAET